MYLVYLFKEKETQKIIYVGSSSRPSARMKEHIQSLDGKKPRSSNQKIYKYMNEKKLKFYKDIEVIWVDCAENETEMRKLEEKYYFDFIDTILNERPGEDLKGKYNPRRRKVICTNDSKTFDTVSECARYYKKSRSTISNVLIKEKPHTIINNEKYFFEYLSIETCNDYLEREYTQVSGNREDE